MTTIVKSAELTSADTWTAWLKYDGNNSIRAASNGSLDQLVANLTVSGTYTGVITLQIKSKLEDGITEQVISMQAGDGANDIMNQYYFEFGQEVRAGFSSTETPTGTAVVRVSAGGV